MKNYLLIAAVLALYLLVGYFDDSGVTADVGVVDSVGVSQGCCK